MCILIAEDEFLLRLVLGEELRHAGFEVYESKSGDDAAALVPTLPTTPRLLITDVVMPGRLDGVALATKLQNEIASLAIIFTTALPELPPFKSREPRQTFFMRKPYTLENILYKAATLLNV